MGKTAGYLMCVVTVLGVCGASWGQLKATNPDPPDGALSVVIPLVQWTAGETAVLHDVYFGTDPDLGPDDLMQSHSPLTMYYHFMGLTPGMTYYWRVDEIEKDGVTIHTGDVWTFTTQAMTAYYPTPADGSNTAVLAPDLTWLPGQEAQKHHVYFSDSEAAVADGAAEADKGIVDDPNYAPGVLLPVSTYYWRVDEVGPGGTELAGEVWSFTTILPVDDFEGYTDDLDAGEAIFQTWIDGVDNGTGSYVGYELAVDGTFGETVIVHSGSQSMPMEYNNTDTPFYSEAERTWAPAQDWATSGVDTLTLYIQGQGADFAIPYVTTPPVIDGEVDDVWALAPVLPINTMIAGEAPDNPADASGQFQVLWDAQNLYAIVEINDDILINDTANSWQDDSVEFYVDGDNTKAGPGLVGNARQYTFGWTTDDIQGTNTNITGVEHAQVDTETGWRIELKFPWQSLKGTDAPIGELVGIDCFYNDDDDGADTRESQIAWHSLVGDDWQTAASWGTALVPDPAAAEGSDVLYVALEDTANRTGVVVHPDPGVVKAMNWVEWVIPLSEFTDAGVSLAAVQTMYIGVGDRENPVPGGVGPVYIDDIYLTKPVPAQE